MRIVKRAPPAITVVPESLEDVWHLEKVAERGDLATARSERRFKTDAGESERKSVKIKIRVESIDYHRTSKKLRLLGTVVEAQPVEYAAIGSHHTIEVAPDVMLTIEKQRWKQYQLDRLADAVKSSRKPKLLIVVMDDEEAEFAWLRDFGLERKCTLRSGKSGKAFPSGKDTYFEDVALAMAGAEKVVVAGPGFTKGNFSKWLNDHDPSLLKRCLFADTGGAGSPGMQEVLKRGIVDKVVKDARASLESALVEELLSKIPTDDATYGLAQVEEALDYGAAEKLLLADSYFSENRAAAEKLLQKAEETRAEAHILSTESEAGERLVHLGGVAATLRFRVPA